jgi:hypothetical protein
MWIFFSFYRRPSHWKFGEKKQLPFTCEEGSQKVFLQIMKSKISLKEDATEGVKFLFLSKSGIIIALGDINHHLWKQLTQTNKHTHTHTHTHTEPTFKGSYQLCNCRWVVVVGMELWRGIDFLSVASLLPFLELSHSHHHCDMNKISQDKEEE